MAHKTLLEIEAEMIQLREALNDSVANRKAYDAWAHNLCMLSLLMDDGRTLDFYAYSDVSSLADRSIRVIQSRGAEFVPTIDSKIEFGVNCGGMGQYHTEPKLFRNVLGRPGMIERVKEIIVASEIKVCGTCMPYTIQAFRLRYPSIPVVIHEFGMNPGKGKLPQFPTFSSTYLGGQPMYD